MGRGRLIRHQCRKIQQRFALFFEIWDIDDTHIELQLYGDNFEVKLSMLYQSISMKGLSEQKRKQSALSGL